LLAKIAKVSMAIVASMVFVINMDSVYVIYTIMEIFATKVSFYIKIFYRS